MSGTQAFIAKLGRLLDLRGREVDRLSAHLAQKEILRQRFQANLERLDDLAAGPSSAGVVPLALSLNRAAYKQGVLQLIDQHRQDLALHEADMAVTQKALGAASRQREVMQRVSERAQQQLRTEQGRREQKRQDELAAQVWGRAQT